VVGLHSATRCTTFSTVSLSVPSSASSTMARKIRSTRPFDCDSVSRKPRPIDDAISSAATRNSHACASASRSPDTSDGSTAGSCTRVKSDTRRRP
jgi:hypothetical protein